MYRLKISVGEGLFWKMWLSLVLKLVCMGQENSRNYYKWEDYLFIYKYLHTLAGKKFYVEMHVACNISPRPIQRANNL